MAIKEVPVLIVGGGPVGLSASLMLGRFGVRSLLVEQHPSTSIFPKARLVNARTMEIFRRCGIEAAVRGVGLSHEKARYLLRARTLAGEELDRREATFTVGMHEGWSPTPPCTCPQNDLEPVLRAAAEQTGYGEIRFQTEMDAFDQDESGVTATIHDRTNGREICVRAQYVIGADGVHSRVREVLGIGRTGEVGLNHTVNILFRADLTPWAEDRPFYLCFITHPEARGTLLTINGTDRWAFGALYDPAQGQRVEDFTPERCAALVRTAVGAAYLPVEILGISAYSGSTLITERYRAGRVFLAGDAAHETTPAGGFGMNTGIQDADNLVWKLAATLRGWADPALVDTYEDERLPVGRTIVEQSHRNTMAALRGIGVAPASAAVPPPSTLRPRPEILGEWGLIFGLAYTSSAVVQDGTSPPQVDNPISDYAPTARPGHRAPHTWLDHDGQRHSTLDLFDTTFTLLTGSSGTAWCAAAASVADALRVPVRQYSIGTSGDLVDPTGGAWSRLYGVGPTGAVLVRPDGHVAWRSRARSADPAATLDNVVRAILGRQG